MRHIENCTKHASRVILYKGDGHFDNFIEKAVLYQLQLTVSQPIQVELQICRCLHRKYLSNNNRPNLFEQSLWDWLKPILIFRFYWIQLE